MQKLRQVSLAAKIIFALKAFAYPEKASVRLSCAFGSLIHEGRIHSLLTVRDTNKLPIQFEWNP